MLAEGPSEERKFCHLTSVHSRTARVQELSETLTAHEDGFPSGQFGCQLRAICKCPQQEAQVLQVIGSTQESTQMISFFARCDSCYRTLPPSTYDGCDHCGQVDIIYQDHSGQMSEVWFISAMSPVAKWLLTILGGVLWSRMQGGWHARPQQRMRFSETVNLGHSEADASSYRKSGRRRRRGIAWWRDSTTCRWGFSSPKTRSPDLLAHEKEVQACPAIMEKVKFNSRTIWK